MLLHLSTIPLDELRSKLLIKSLSRGRLWSRKHPMYPSGPDGVNAAVLLSSSNSNDTDLQVSAFRLAASYKNTIGNSVYTCLVSCVYTM